MGRQQPEGKDSQCFVHDIVVYVHRFPDNQGRLDCFPDFVVRPLRNVAGFEPRPNYSGMERRRRLARINIQKPTETLLNTSLITRLPQLCSTVGGVPKLFPADYRRMNRWTSKDWQ